MLACSSLVASRTDHFTPLRPREWSRVAERAEAARIDIGDLSGLTQEDLVARLRIEPDLAAKLVGSFARHGQLTLELERLNRMGIWAMTTQDEHYPAVLRERLAASAPPVLFGLGEPSLLDMDALAIVGSRDADETVMHSAADAGRLVAKQGWAVVSGAARGVDQASMRAAYDAGGTVVGIPADGLERHVRDGSVREAVASKQAVYVSPYRPDARFTIGSAMGRNKLIYCLATMSLVVHSTDEGGGTWAGAVEALRRDWVDVLVLRDGDDTGNAHLADQGAIVVEMNDLESLDAVQPTVQRANSENPGSGQLELEI